MAAITMRNVYYRYPNSTAWTLEDVSLSIPWGRTLVVGETGSGKSTLLRVASGVASRIYGGILKGAVKVHGRAVLVPQNFDVFILMPTPRLELIYVMENLGMDRRSIDEAISTLSSALGVENLLDRPVSSLSVGERQKAAIASALALRPDILMLDEPLAYVDPQSMFKVLNALSQHGVNAIIVSEHRIHVFREWASHLVYVDKGRVRYSGPLKGVKGLPLGYMLQLLDPGEAARVAEAEGCLGGPPKGG